MEADREERTHPIVLPPGGMVVLPPGGMVPPPSGHVTSPSVTPL